MTSPDKLSAAPVNESGKLRSIEAARALAAVSVALMHAANLMRVDHFSGHIGLGGIFDFGYVGVDFFFVLSGFIITYVHFAEIDQPGSIPRYLWRRFSRIFPIYWAILLLFVVVTSLGRLAQGKGPEWAITSISDVLGTVFLMMGQGEPKYVGVAWSLQYEVVFYIAFCLLLANVRIGAALFAAWGAFVAARAMGLVQLELPLNLGNAHCLQFLFGIVVGATVRRFPLRASPVVLVPVLLALVAAIVFEVYGPFERHSAPGRIALGLASAAVLTTLVALENSQALRTPSWLVRIGSVSYSVYLGHILILNLAYMILLKLGLYHALPEVLVYAIALGAALAVTLVIGLYIELPLVRLLKNRWRGESQRLRTAVVGN